jgi:hypothetical protein
MSSSTMTAEMAGEIIAPYVEKSWPNDEDIIYNILDLVQETIWKAGLFEGSTKWAVVKTRQDGTVVTPHCYPILIGAKTGHCKFDIKDSYFSIHENGPLRDPDESASFSKAIQFVGAYPTLINHINDARLSKKFYKLGVIAECLPPSGSPPLTVISANGKDGRRIFTYRFSESNDPEIIDDEEVLRDLGPDDISMNEGILEGIIYPITSKLITYDNVVISEIYNITKDPSLSRVDYYAFDLSDTCCKRGVLIASLDPFQTVSKYSVYKVVDKCVSNGKIFGLFKKDRPEKIINKSQLILTNSRIGLIALSKAMQYMYFKDNVDKGNVFLQKGLEDISKELTAANPGTDTTIQIKDERKKLAHRNFR